MNKNCAKHILIVEDSCDMRLLLKILLEARGYTTECTSNGQEALTLLNSSTKLPDTILLDLRMPVMDGLTFHRLQKANQRLSGIPVVIMSGVDDTTATRAKTKSDILQKPLNIISLLETLKRNSRLH